MQSISEYDRLTDLVFFSQNDTVAYQNIYVYI